MSAKFEYDPTSNILTAWPSGEVTFNDVLVFFEEILTHESVKSGFIEVVHFDNVKKFAFSSAEANKIAQKYKIYKDKKGVLAIIFVGIKPYHFGMGRMMKSVFEMNISDYPIYFVSDKQEIDGLIKRIKKENIGLTSGVRGARHTNTHDFWR